MSAPAQRREPGVHTQPVQLPPVHDVMPAQVTVLYPPPSIAHTRMLDALAHWVDPGVQTHA
jgi:hypothetical protein